MTQVFTHQRGFCRQPQVTDLFLFLSVPFFPPPPASFPGTPQNHRQVGGKGGSDCPLLWLLENKRSEALQAELIKLINVN